MTGRQIVTQANMETAQSINEMFSKTSFSNSGLKLTLFLSEEEREATRAAGDGRAQKCFLWTRMLSWRVQGRMSTLLTKEHKRQAQGTTISPSPRRGNVSTELP